MRILHLASGREWRGGQRQTLLLARGLARLPGLSQTVVTARGGELAGRLARVGVTVLTASWQAGVDPRALLPSWSAAREADLLHAHDGHAVAIGALVSRLTGRPLIATRRMARPLSRSGPWRRAARVIAISQAVKDSLLLSGIAPGRIEVIAPAIEVDPTSRIAPVDWSSELALPRGAHVAVTVAALTREKGIDLLLEAAAALHARKPELHWVVAGDGPERAALEARIRALEIAPFVHFLGHLVDPLPVIAGATLLVVPSREEGFGSVILDALALGIPVVASAVGGVPEALAGGGGETVPGGNVPALITAVERLLDDPARRVRLGEDARRAARHFDLDAMVERVAVLYRSVKESVEAQ